MRLSCSVCFQYHVICRCGYCQRLCCKTLDRRSFARASGAWRSWKLGQGRVTLWNGSKELANHRLLSSPNSSFFSRERDLELGCASRDGPSPVSASVQVRSSNRSGASNHPMADLTRPSMAWLGLQTSALLRCPHPARDCRTYGSRTDPQAIMIHQRQCCQCCQYCLACLAYYLACQAKNRLEMSK